MSLGSGFGVEERESRLRLSASFLWGRSLSMSSFSSAEEGDREEDGHDSEEKGLLERRYLGGGVFIRSTSVVLLMKSISVTAWR